MLVNTPLRHRASRSSYNNRVATSRASRRTPISTIPAIGWTWSGGRVNIQNERRDTETQGAHLDVRLGTSERNVTIGARVRRRLARHQGSRQQPRVAASGVRRRRSVHSRPRMRSPPATVGGASAIPAGEPRVLPDRRGRPASSRWISIVSSTTPNYHALSDAAPLATGSATSARSGGVQEKTTGGYIEGNYRAGRLRPFAAGQRRHPPSSTRRRPSPVRATSAASRTPARSSRTRRPTPRACRRRTSPTTSPKASSRDCRARGR